MTRGGFAIAPAVLLAAAVIVVGCADTTHPMPTMDESRREATEQSFGPEYPKEAPAGTTVRIDQATLSQDKRTLTIEFVGGKGYLAADPCATDYEPWVARHGDELDVEVVRVSHADQATLGPSMACTAEGHSWTFHLALAEPFTGTTVNDLGGGGRLVVAEPPDTAQPIKTPGT